MKIWRCQKRKLNNKGLSLVEIVVAMLILAAVSVTVMSVLVYSIRLNSRSRTRQQTTAVAQTVMETFKAYSVQEIGEQFAANNLGGSSAGTFLIIDPAKGESLTAPVSDGDTDFRILRYLNGEYDVEIELRRHDIHTEGGTYAADMNTLIYKNFTAEDSAVYVGSLGMDADALSQIAKEVATAWNAQEALATPAPGMEVIVHTEDDVDLNKVEITERKLIFEVKKNVEGNYVAEVSCEYTYKVEGHPCGVGGTFDIAPTSYEYDYWDGVDGKTRKEIFVQPTELKNLVIYYYPAYKIGEGSAVNIAKDELVIGSMPHDVGEDVPKLSCYIYKQQNMAVNDAKVAYSDLGYKLNLSLGDQVYIYDDNLNVVLGSPTSISSQKSYYDSIPTRYHGISYAARESIDYLSPSPGATPIPIGDAERNVTMKKQRLMYDITVSVYRQGEISADASVPSPTSPPLCVLKGTIIE